MPKGRGTFLAVRSRDIQTRRGVVKAYEMAYVPEGDANGFPAVIKVELGVFSDLDRVESGEQVSFRYIETPPYGDNLIIDLSVESAKSQDFLASKVG